MPLRPRGPLLGVLLAPAEGWVVPILERGRVRALLVVGISIIAGSPNQAAGRLLLARSGRGCVSYHNILIKSERPAVAATRRMQHDRRLREETRARGGGGSRARASASDARNLDARGPELRLAGTRPARAPGLARVA